MTITYNDASGYTERTLVSGAMSRVFASVNASVAQKLVATNPHAVQPLHVAEAWTHKAEGNGEGFAPYFIGLSLYVGALILWMLISPLDRGALLGGARPWKAVRSALASTAMVGVVSAVIVVGGLHLLLGLHAHFVAETLALVVLAAVTFLAIQQAVIIWLGDALGRLVILIVLIVQLAAAGGTYPIETSPAFFRAISPCCH